MKNEHTFQFRAFSEVTFRSRKPDTLYALRRFDVQLSDMYRNI